jgi:error-prone DNA polymerase
VHPYLRRRNGEEPEIYPSEELKAILKRTKGVPLFQEQAMEIAIVAAGFTPAEADGLRRSMATFKVKGMVSQYQQKLVEGMVGKGYEREFAERVFKQLEGFGSYGFPESHAASFALLVYVSCWLKWHYPDVFATAILNSMPMGFYQPAQLVIDARNHGVEVRPVDVNFSMWDNQMEERSGKYFALRLGFRQVKGLREADVAVLISARAIAYTSIHALYDCGVPMAALEKLADADAFRSMGMDRRQALWEVSALADTPIALFSGQPSESDLESQVSLPLMGDEEHVVHDYATTSLSLKAHPISFIRDKLRMLHICSKEELGQVKDGQLVKVAGLVLVRQRPGTAGGVCFITIEDETGFTNLVVFQGLFDTYRKEILQSRLLMVEGKLQREGLVVHVIVKRCFDLSKLLRGLALENESPAAKRTSPDLEQQANSFPLASNKRSQVRESAQKEIFPVARNFNRGV